MTLNTKLNMLMIMVLVMAAGASVNFVIIASAIQDRHVEQIQTFDEATIAIDAAMNEYNTGMVAALQELKDAVQDMDRNHRADRVQLYTDAKQMEAYIFQLESDKSKLELENQELYGNDFCTEAQMIVFAPGSAAAQMWLNAPMFDQSKDWYARGHVCYRGMEYIPEDTTPESTESGGEVDSVIKN